MTLPPPRPAHLFAHEQGEPQQHAQAAFLRHLVLLCDGVSFDGSAKGSIACEQLDDHGARLAFTSNIGAGHITLSRAENGWVRAELYLADTLILRAWLEDPYEEKAFWPDGADGIGDAPGRISKRGAWLTIDCARFPGVPANAHGFWQVEEAD